MEKTKTRVKGKAVDLDYGEWGEIERITSDAKKARITINFDKTGMPIYVLQVGLKLAPHELARLVSWLRMGSAEITITNRQLELPEPAQGEVR